MALTWTNLGTRRSHIETQSAIATAIPDNNPTGITRTFNLTTADPMRLEHVLLSLGITHQRRGDLDIRLTAPSGISDVFFVPHNDVNQDLPLNFPLLSVRHWGETIQGTWTVTVSDRTAANTGTLNDLRLEFFGTRGTPLAATPVITSPAAVTGQQNTPFTYQITANNNPASFAATNLPAGLTLNTTNGHQRQSHRHRSGSDVSCHASKQFAARRAQHLLATIEKESPRSLLRVNRSARFDRRMCCTDCSEPATNRSCAE